MKQLRADIEEEVHTNFIKKLPWGWSAHLIRKLIYMCMDLHSTHGNSFIMAIIQGKCEIKYIQRFKPKED